MPHSRLLAALPLAIALTALLLGRSPAAAQDTPAPSPDAEDGVRLPFLARDGEERRDAVRFIPTTPTLLEGTVRSFDVRDADTPRTFEARRAWRPWAFPDVDDLLASAGLEARPRHGRVVLEDAERATGERLVGAVRAAFGRRLRVELLVLWADALGASPTDAPELLDAPPAAAVALRVDRTLGEGAIWWSDTRRDATFPGRFEIDPWALYTATLNVRAGTVVGLAACTAGRAPGADDRPGPRAGTARIGFHVADVVGTRRLTHPPLEARAPRVRYAVAALDVPVVLGRARRVDVGGAEGFVAVVRVTLAEEPAAPAGTRAYGAHDRGPLFVRPEDDEYDTGVMTVESTDESAGLEHVDRTTVVPAAWTAAAGDVRLAVVEPGVVIATGAESALVRLDAVVARSACDALAPRRLTLASNEHPLLDVVRHGRRPGFVTWGVLEPLAVEANAEIASDNGFTVTSIQHVARGGRVTWETDGGATTIRVRRIDLRHVDDATPEAHRVRRQSWTTRESQILALDDVRVTTEHLELSVLDAAGAAQRGALTLRDAAWDLTK